MSANTFDKVNWKRVEELLLKEDFRRLIINSGKAESYILDTIGYTSAPNVIACFQDHNVWKVYETDDRANVRKERTFDSAYLAYKNAAARRGLTFSTSVSMENKMYSGIVYQKFQMHTKRSAIKTALQNTRKLAEILAGEKSGEAAAEDAKVLNAALEELEMFSASLVKIRSELAKIPSIEFSKKVRVGAIPVKPRKVYDFPSKVAKVKAYRITRRDRNAEHLVRFTEKKIDGVMSIKAVTYSTSKFPEKADHFTGKGKKFRVISVTKKG